MNKSSEIIPQSKIKKLHLWLKIYNIFYCVIYALCTIGFFVVALLWLPGNKTIEVGNSLCCFYGFFVLLSFVLALFFMIGAIEVKQKSKKIWKLQIILVAIGLNSILSFVPSVLLLIELLSDDVKKYYEDE